MKIKYLSIFIIALISNAFAQTTDPKCNDRTPRPHVDWAGCDFKRANLGSGAQLSHAKLARIHFHEANLGGANLSGDVKNQTITTDLSDAFLINANLVGTNFAYTNLVGADLRGSDLAYANLSGAHLCKAKLPASSYKLAIKDRNTVVNGAELYNDDGKLISTLVGEGDCKK